MLFVIYIPLVSNFEKYIDISKANKSLSNICIHNVSENDNVMIVVVAQL